MSHPFPQPPLFTGEIRSQDPAILELLRRVVQLQEHAEKVRQHIDHLVPEYKKGSAVYDPPNLVDGAGTTTTVTVTGAALGDLAFAAFSLDTQGITVTAWVSAVNTVSVRFQNESGGALNLASGTLYAWSLQPPDLAQG